MIRYRLQNGLRVVQEPIPYLRSVSLGIWVKSGSRYENPSNNGISHLIEHMLFKGTEKYSAKEIAEIFDGIGGDVNAFTAKEYTCYYVKVLDEHFPLAVEVLADMFLNSTLLETELEKEKNVVLEEIAMYEDTPDDYVHDLICEAAYGNHPLAYSILGNEQALSMMEVEHLRAYMQEHYHTDNIVISVAGRITDDVQSLLEHHFGRFDNQGNETVGRAPQFLGSKKFHPKSTEQNHICIAYPGFALNDKRLFGAKLLNNAIGGSMSSRLFQEIREERGLAYSVYSYHAAHEDSGLFTIYIGTAPNQTDEVLKITLDIIDQIRTAGLTEQELRNGKEHLKGDYLLHLEGSGSHMSRIGKNELMLKKQISMEEWVNQVKSVTLEDIALTAKQIFQKQYAIAMVGKTDDAMIKIGGGNG